MNDLPSPPLPFPSRANDVHKGAVGRVLLIGGSRGMSGAIALASMAALKTGSGLVSAAIPDRCLETVASYHPAVMTIPVADDSAGQFSVDAVLPTLRRYDAIGLGPGMGTGAGSIRIVETLLSRVTQPRVFDADAINVLSENRLLDESVPQEQSQLVLTPHPGELARLVGVSPDHRAEQVKAARQLANQHGFTIVVKGGPTEVVAPGEHYVNATGNPGMATAGSGDVLTGMITSLLGQGLSPWDAARLGVFTHGLSGDLAASIDGVAGMTSVEILNQVPQAIRGMAVG
ncbi:MAG: NAD(P)H-hydrate dehydratase [Planctomycetota bacterium]